MVHLSYSCIVNKSLEDAWKLMGNFNDVSWLSDAKLTIEKSGRQNDMPVRVISFGDKILKEHLISLTDEVDHKVIKYSFEKEFTGFNVDNLVGCMQFFRISQSNQTFFLWEADFDLKPGQEKGKEEVIGFLEFHVKKVSELKK